jgi:hypothetical protein
LINWPSILELNDSYVTYSKTWRTPLSKKGSLKSNIWVQLKSVFAVVLPEVTLPEVTLVTWPEVTSVMCPVRKHVLRMCNRKLRNIRSSGAFWPEVTKSRDRKRPCPKWPWLEVGSAHARLFPAFFFFLVVVTWLPDVTKGHLTPFGVPLDVHMRNRKLRNTRSSTQCWLGVFSTTSASYYHRKPRVL